MSVWIEHAMIHGFLKAPKNVGTEFYIQPVNYSDKSNIQMHKVNYFEYVGQVKIRTNLLLDT
jgi:hypothetical protein